MHASAFTTSVPGSQLQVRRDVLRTCSPQRRKHYRVAVRATATVPPHSSVEEDDGQVHESWSIYSEPGNPCVLCHGKGEVKCLYCFGEGTVIIGPEKGRDAIECPQCKGSGREICIRCDGTGIRPSTRLDPETGKTYRNPTNEEVRTTKQRKARAEADAKAQAEGTKIENVGQVL